MGFFFALIAVTGESFAKTIDKLNFTRNKITYRQSLLVCFIAMTVFLGVFTVVTHQPLPHITATSLGLLALVALFSFGGNVFDEMSLQANDLSLREPMVDFEPILAGLVGYALFPGERKPILLIAFIASAVVVYWGTHRRRLGKRQRKGMGYLLLAAVLYAVLPSIYKEALQYMTPAYLSFFRVASILVLLAVFLPVRKVTKLSPKKINYATLAAFIYSIEAIASMYAIKTLGVAQTMLLLTLGPAMRYWTSSVILKEKVRRGEMWASAILTSIVLLVFTVK